MRFLRKGNNSSARLPSFGIRKYPSGNRCRGSPYGKSVINYIGESYFKNITSKSASEELGYDQSYFCRTFKKLFGLKFNEYLNIHRIKVAKELLKEESVSLAATKSGFSSISYFSVVFKKITGMTPMQYKTK